MESLIKIIIQIKLHYLELKNADLKRLPDLAHWNDQVKKSQVTPGFLCCGYDRGRVFKYIGEGEL